MSFHRLAKHTSWDQNVELTGVMGENSAVKRKHIRKPRRKYYPNMACGSGTIWRGMFQGFSWAFAEHWIRVNGILQSILNTFHFKDLSESIILHVYIQQTIFYTWILFRPLHFVSSFLLFYVVCLFINLTKKNDRKFISVGRHEIWNKP